MEKIKDKFLGATVTLIAALIAFYFGSFASDKRVDTVEARTIENKKEIKKTKTDIKKIKDNQCEMAILQFGKKKAINICKDE